jgi:hypothetical protein
MDDQEPEQQDAGAATRHGWLPFSVWYPLLGGAIYGLVLRLVFSGEVAAGLVSFETVSIAFAILVPVAIGAITVYLAEKQLRRSVQYYIFAPWWSVLICVLGSAITLLEGSICIVMATPLFLLFGSVGGVVMGMICRLYRKPVYAVNSLALLPFLVAIGETGQPIPGGFAEIQRSIHVAAPSGVVWHYINYPTDIKPAELAGGFAYRIGVPYPVEARTLQPGVGGMRRLVWQRGVTFDEEITAWEEGRHIAWRYLFDANSFPPGSMDEHVEIGGRYFDLDDTSYTLTPEAGGTRLDISVKFRVSTRFNWYARPWAEFLISDTAEAILMFYKNRSEKAQEQGVIKMPGKT